VPYKGQEVSTLVLDGWTGNCFAVPNVTAHPQTAYHVVRYNAEGNINIHCRTETRLGLDLTKCYNPGIRLYSTLIPVGLPGIRNLFVTFCFK